MALTKIERRCLEVLLEKLKLKPGRTHLTLPGNPWTQDDTETIAKATEIWRESWILPVIEALLQEPKGDGERYSKQGYLASVARNI